MAPREVHDFLGNLKQALYEERSHLRTIRHRLRDCPRSLPSGDIEADPALHILEDTIRHMISEFTALERPFLVDQTSRPPPPPHPHLRRLSQVVDDTFNAAERGEANAAAVQAQAIANGEKPPPPEENSQSQSSHLTSSYTNSYSLEKSQEDMEQDESERTYYTAVARKSDYYRHMSLRLRYIWLRRRQAVVDVAERLNRIQTRRIAKQVRDLAVMMQGVEKGVGRVEGGIRRVKNELGRWDVEGVEIDGRFEV